MLNKVSDGFDLSARWTTSYIYTSWGVTIGADWDWPQMGQIRGLFKEQISVQFETKNTEIILKSTMIGPIPRQLYY